jgi:predicted solute-binding protein
VRSILLISKVPFQQIRTLAVDSSSRTSVMLSRIVLARKYGAFPEIRSQRPDLAEMLDFEDACLIIGDPALLLDPADMPFHVLDLGAEWMEITVFPWCSPSGRSAPDCPRRILSRSSNRYALEKSVWKKSCGASIRGAASRLSWRASI